MECAGKGSKSPCVGPPTRPCDRCKAVFYCSISHQVSHRSVHRRECERLKEQMKLVHLLNDFPFTYANETTIGICERRETRCSFLKKQGVHGKGMWRWECRCAASAMSYNSSTLIQGWDLTCPLCPCIDTPTPITEKLSCWKEYYEWRGIPLCSPVALLLHWPLTVYWMVQLTTSRSLTPSDANELCIHYLGPEREILQLAIFGELHALLPGVNIRIEFVGAAIPQDRDGEVIDLHNYAKCIDTVCPCKLTSRGVFPKASPGEAPRIRLRLHSGYYHDLYWDISKDSPPNLIVAPNAGVAAYMSWLPTIALIKEIQLPALFSDYCEEAAHMAVSCISRVTGNFPNIPIQLNPFRQPLALEDTALSLPCYSNCFVFGMSSNQSVTESSQTGDSSLFESCYQDD
ncbi:hypothetical protein LIER_13764 [Lithospermum erythrorhizon]|uniref:Zinc finger MYND domain-containing protein 15 n=1 Tax=Lithospermum erythrorhizon TaxID=34254 RepID=A0AAV3PWQ7_LITER